MAEYKCYVCRKTYEIDGELPKISDDEAILCDKCADVVKRLTGIEGRDLTNDE